MRFLALCLLIALAPLARAQTAAQDTLPITTLTVGKYRINAEVADDSTERQTGLMFRKKLEPDSGMLFIFPNPNPVAFWMHNTLIPLSVAYIDAGGQILEIHSMKPLDDTAIPSHFNNVTYALEMDDGWFQKNGILPGDHIQGLPSPDEAH